MLNFRFAVGRRAAKWDACDPKLKSFAHMAAVALVGCSFCLDLGYFMAHNEGLDEAKAREVPRWRESPVFTPLKLQGCWPTRSLSRCPSCACGASVDPSAWSRGTRSRPGRGC